MGGLQVNKEENEEVVQAVMDQAQAKGFRLSKTFPNWKRRGLPLFSGAKKLLRIDPYNDGTDGFFIACFER